MTEIDKAKPLVILTNKDTEKIYEIQKSIDYLTKRLRKNPEIDAFYESVNDGYNNADDCVVCSLQGASAMLEMILERNLKS